MTAQIIKPSISSNHGYQYGKAPSMEALQLEEAVGKALNELGAKEPYFMKWSTKGLLSFLRTKVKYGEGVSPNFVLNNTLELMGNSHPHIKKWEQLSAEEIFDFLVGTDIVVDYKGLDGKTYRLGFDVTCNPGAVKAKMEKCSRSYMGARMDIMYSLGFHHYIVVLVDKRGKIDKEKLNKELDKLLKEEEFICSVDLS